MDHAIAAAPTAANGIRISSVAYATEDSASDDKTARAFHLGMRSCAAMWVEIGSPIISLLRPANMGMCKAQSRSVCGPSQQGHSEPDTKLRAKLTLPEGWSLSLPGAQFFHVPS